MAEVFIADVEYRDVVGCPGYRVGSDGSILSFKNGNKWKQLKLTQGKVYLVVRLTSSYRVSKVHFVHRVICKAFHGECPNEMECRHLDGNTHNNTSMNLAWGTHSENQMDKHRHGTMNCGVDHFRAKLTPEKVKTIREMLSAGVREIDVAAEFGVSQSAIKHVRHRRCWNTAD